MQPARIATWNDIPLNAPAGALVANTDLVIVRWGEEHKDHAVLYGRCLHRGALLADGHIEGQNLICGLHGWDYVYETGVSSYNNAERLHKFSSWVEDGALFVDEEQVRQWETEHPQPYDRGAYQGAFQDPHGAPEEPHTGLIGELASRGLDYLGHHGPVAAMGVPRDQLPSWESIQFVTAQLARLPQLDDVPVDRATVIGPNAARPLSLALPVFVSDMSFGALSMEAKVALSRGAELSGTGICSGEGGVLPEEQAENSRYFYEYASGKFGFDIEVVKRSRAFHFKLGQGAKTGTGGHLPGAKVTEKIAAVRNLEPGQDATSPSRFTDFDCEDDFRHFADDIREATGGIPIGVKMSAQHIEDDIDAALRIGVDYIILDGRGGGTGAAPTLFRNNISVPTIPALARARRHLDARGRRDVSLIITGGLRTPDEFARALALGASAIGVSNAAIQAIGCLGMRACHTNNCPVGIATQKEKLRARLPVDEAAGRLHRFFEATSELMAVLARACGHTGLDQFCADDLTTFDREMAHLTGIAYGGVSP